MRKSDMTPMGIHKKGSVTKHTGKGALEQHLPSPAAMQTLTGGNPADRGMNNYAKASPMPALQTQPGDAEMPMSNDIGDGLQ